MSQDLLPDDALGRIARSIDEALYLSLDRANQVRVLRSLDAAIAETERNDTPDAQGARRDLSWRWMALHAAHDAQGRALGERPDPASVDAERRREAIRRALALAAR
jgi:hypothetical protein